MLWFFLAQSIHIDLGPCFRLISGDGVEVTTWVHVEKIDSMHFQYVDGVNNHPQATQSLESFELILPEADTIPRYRFIDARLFHVGNLFHGLSGRSPCSALSGALCSSGDGAPGIRHRHPRTPPRLPETGLPRVV